MRHSKFGDREVLQQLRANPHRRRHTGTTPVSLRRRLGLAAGVRLSFILTSPLLAFARAGGGSHFSGGGGGFGGGGGSFGGGGGFGGGGLLLPFLFFGGGGGGVIFFLFLLFGL